MSEKDYRALDVLMGADEEKILKTFGKPHRPLNSVKLYKGKRGSTLAIVFHSPEGKTVVKALALFSATGEVLHVRNIRLIDEETVKKAKDAETFKQAQKVLGLPTTDIGSGQQIFAYFTTQAQLMTLQHFGNENVKLTLLKLTGEEAEI